jgi:hypothetical protein
MSLKICNVGPVSFDRAGGPPGYGFKIFDTRGKAPKALLTLVYATRYEAMNAHFVFEQMIMALIDVRQ